MKGVFREFEPASGAALRFEQVQLLLLTYSGPGEGRDRCSQLLQSPLEGTCDPGRMVLHRAVGEGVDVTALTQPGIDPRRPLIDIGPVVAGVRVPDQPEHGRASGGPRDHGKPGLAALLGNVSVLVDRPGVEDDPADPQAGEGGFETRANFFAVPGGVAQLEEQWGSSPRPGLEESNQVLFQLDSVGRWKLREDGAEA